jgi:hypothetical protein
MNLNTRPPPSTEIKNEWSCISTPPIRLYDKYRVTFTFYFLNFNYCLIVLKCPCVCVCVCVYVCVCGGGGSNGTVMSKKKTRKK